MRVFNHGVINTLGAIHFLDRPHRLRAGFHMKPVDFEQEEINLLIELQKSLSKILPKEDYQKVLFLFSALYIKDRDTALHSLRVRDYALAIAGKCKLTYEEEVAVLVGAPLHDIGKLEFSDSLFTSKAPLTRSERDLIKKHPDFGAVIIEKMGLHYPGLIEAVRGHHERINGSGYPDGLSGSRSSLLARIIAAADTRDALTSDRPYQKPLDEATAMQKLWESNHHFDREIVKELQQI